MAMRFKWRPKLLSLALLASWLITAGEAGAVPRYSARYGQSCTLCHQNPTGGGMRTLYASQLCLLLIRPP